MKENNFTFEENEICALYFIYVYVAWLMLRYFAKTTKIFLHALM
jgi:hypothetical protein